MEAVDNENQTTQHYIQLISTMMMTPSSVDDRRARSATRSVSSARNNYNFAAVAAAALNHSTQSLDYQVPADANYYPRSPVHQRVHQQQPYVDYQSPGAPPPVQQQPGYYSPSPKRSGPAANFYWTARV